MFSSDNAIYKANSVHGCSENLSLLDFYTKSKKKIHMLKRPCASARLRLNRSSDFHEILSRVPYNTVLGKHEPCAKRINDRRTLFRA